jgi:hypothetical protein
VVRELERIIGTDIEQALRPIVGEAIEELFVNELWRCKNADAQRRLVEHLQSTLKSTARLDFGHSRT